MGLDIRLPIGLMFAIQGILLAGYGLLGDKTVYLNHSLGININLIWGSVMIVFGLLMIALGKFGGSRAPTGAADNSNPPRRSH